MPFPFRPTPPPEGITPSVHALVDKLNDPARDVDDWIHAALTLPDMVETPKDRAYAVRTLCLKLDGIGPASGISGSSHTRLDAHLAESGKYLAFIFLCFLPGAILSADWSVFSLPLLMILLIVSFVGPFLPLLIAQASGKVGARRKTEETQAACAQSLGIMADMSAVETLARHAADNHERVRSEVRKALGLLLPALAQQPEILLGAEASDKLSQILPEVSEALAGHILRALISSGASSALPSLEALRPYSTDPGLQPLVTEAIATLQERRAKALHRSTLLRPAETEPDKLLRPAAPAEQNPEYLLHAVQSEDGG